MSAFSLSLALCNSRFHRRSTLYQGRKRELALSVALSPLSTKPRAGKALHESDRDSLAEIVESDESAAVDVVDTPAGTQPVAADGSGEKRVCDDCAHMSGLPCFDCYLDGHEIPADAIAPADVDADDAVTVELGYPSEGA